MGREVLMVTFLKDIFAGKPVVGAEIGVLAGDSAEYTLQTLNMQKLYLIDPYCIDDPEYLEVQTEEIATSSKRRALERLAPFSDKIRWIYKRSDDAISSIEEPLDFVYIDGNHSYPFVVRDLQNYFLLIKPDGYIGGHDYSFTTMDSGVFGVTRAVGEFIVKYGGRLTTQWRFRSSSFPGWWLPKSSCTGHPACQEVISSG